MSWDARGRPGLDGADKRSLGAGVFHRCGGCGATHLAELLAQRLGVCPGCGHAERLSAAQWLSALVDDGSFVPFAEAPAAGDPLRFTDGVPYPERLRRAQKSSGLPEALLAGDATLAGRAIVAGVFVFGFMGGSMGSVVGELLCRVFERGAATRAPVVVLSASGGARMQEGIFSLMQMAKHRGRARSAARRGRALRVGAAQPDHGRRRRELRPARRRQPRRARRPHRLRGPPGHRADPAAAAARGLSAQRSTSWRTA
jgi:acetyl-CoA carboxylase beta subunit